MHVSKCYIKYLQWEMYRCCPSSTSGMLLLNRELPQDETARRISSLPHILILSWVWTTHTAATSTTIRDTKHLAADIVWCVTAPWLVSGERNWMDREMRSEVGSVQSNKDVRLWGELEGVYIVNVCYPEPWFQKCWGHRLFSLGEGKACPDLELSMRVMRSLLKAETLIEIKTLQHTLALQWSTTRP